MLPLILLVGLHSMIGVVGVASAGPLFRAALSFDVGDQSSPFGDAPYSVAVGEVNGDSKLDLITANGSSTVSVLLGNGDGTFQVKTDYETGFCPQSVAVGDVSLDGKADLVTAKTVKMFDLHGRLVRILAEIPLLPAGVHELEFDGRDDRGRVLASGVYFYRIEAVSGSPTGRIAILK
jgi:hypothetical protein